MSGGTFGRDRELAALRAAVTDAGRGAGASLVITGPAGIGKSHLLRAAIGHARALGVTVAARAAFELDLAEPMHTLAMTLRAGGLAVRPAAPGRPPTIDDLRRSLEDFSTGRPLVVVIDDAQWTDELSALAVRELVPALATSPVTWLFAHRPERVDRPGRQTMSWLVREGARQLVLGALDDPAITRLCADVLGAEADDTVLALAAGCGGVPLQVKQLLNALRMTDQVVIDAGVATVVGDELPASFVATVQGLLAHLSAGAQRMLRAGSVFGRPFGIPAVARLLNRPAAELVPVVEEATAAGVLTDVDGALTFTHDRVRLAVYGTLGEAVSALLHQQAAVITRDEGRAPVEVAEHLLNSGRQGTREAVAMLHAAARAVAEPAPATAADLILHALSVAGEHHPDRPALTADAVGLLASAGRLAQARELGEAVLRAGLTAATEATLLLGLAEAFKHAGQNETAVGYAEQGLRHPELPAPTRAKLYAIRAHALFYVGDLTGADRSGAIAGEVGDGCGEFGASVFGRTARSLVAQAEGRFGDALAHARTATDLADRVGGEAVHRHPRIWLGSALVTLDRFDEAERTFRQGRHESRQLGTAWSAPLWHFYNTALLTARGRLDEATAEADGGVSVAERLAHQLTVPLLGALIRLAVLRDDLDQAREHRRRMRELIRTGITAAPEDVAWAEAVLLDAAGDPAAALDTLTGVYDVLPQRPVLMGQDPAAAAALVRIAVAAGDPVRAELAVKAARNLAGLNPALHSAAAAAAHAEGLLRGDRGRLRLAVDEFRLTPRPLALAGALTDAGALGRAAGDEAEAAYRWREALAIATRCGAHRSRRRLRDLLGETPPGEPEPPVLPLLSPAERKVAMLVAQGWTNLAVADHLFLSKHTIDSHLRNIFKKLGINRRVELAALVARGAGRTVPEGVTGHKIP